MIIFAQIIAIFAIITYSFAPHQKSKIKVLIFKIVSNSLYTLQYLILGAMSAAGTNLINVLQSIIFYKYAKENKKVPIFWGVVFSIIIILLGIFSYTSITSIIPIVLALITTYGIWQDNLKIYRITCAFTIFCWIFYNLYLSAYVSAVGNIYQFISTIIAIYKLNIKNVDNEKILNKEP